MWSRPEIRTKKPKKRTRLRSMFRWVLTVLCSSEWRDSNSRLRHPKCRALPTAPHPVTRSLYPKSARLSSDCGKFPPRNGRRNGRRFASASLPSHAGPAAQAPPHPSRCSRCSHPSRRFRRSRGFERTQAPRRPRPPSCLACLACFACIRGSISAKFVKSLDLSAALCYNLQKEQICFL